MNAHSIINTQYLDENYLQFLHEQLFSTDNVKHIVLDNFLNEDFIENLYSEFTNNIKIETGNTDGKTIHLLVGKYAREFYSFYNGETFRNIVSTILGEKISVENNIGKTSMVLFFGRLLKKLGCFIRINTIGSELGWHTDGPIEKTAGSFSLYLNKGYSESNGGIFELGKYVNGQIQKYDSVLPIYNRVIILKAEKNISWHRVSKTLSTERIFFHDQILKRTA